MRDLGECQPPQCWRLWLWKFIRPKSRASRVDFCLGQSPIGVSCRNRCGRRGEFSSHSEHGLYRIERSAAPWVITRKEISGLKRAANSFRSKRRPGRHWIAACLHAPGSARAPGATPRRSRPTTEDVGHGQKVSGHGGPIFLVEGVGSACFLASHFSSPRRACRHRLQAPRGSSEEEGPAGASLRR